MSAGDIARDALESALGVDGVGTELLLRVGGTDFPIRGIRANRHVDGPPLVTAKVNGQSVVVLASAVTDLGLEVGGDVSAFSIVADGLSWPLRSAEYGDQARVTVRLDLQPPAGNF